MIPRGDAAVWKSFLKKEDAMGARQWSTDLMAAVLNFISADSTSTDNSVRTRNLATLAARTLSDYLDETEVVEEIGYVRSEQDGRYLHLLVASKMGLIPEGDIFDRPERVEHINGNTLDNTRGNLRLAEGASDGQA